MQPEYVQFLTEFTELSQRMQAAVEHSDIDGIRSIGKRMAELRPVVERLEEMTRQNALRSDAIASEGDTGLREMAVAQRTSAEARIAVLEREVAELLIPRDPLDQAGAILEVRAGAGGDEAALFASELLRMYLRYLERRGYTTEMVETSHQELGGIKSATVRIPAEGVYGLLKNEGGVHRVQRIPATEAKGRIHTSTASVAVLPIVAENAVEVRSEDLTIDTYRAGGAGGQHVNKTESAVRITHVPTGIVVTCQSERSQLQNRARAMEILRGRLYEHQQSERHRGVDQLRSEQIKTGDRSDKIRTYNFPQDRLTDHRIEQSYHNLPAIMEGGIDAVIEDVRVGLMEKASSPSPLYSSTGDALPSSGQPPRGQG